MWAKISTSATAMACAACIATAATLPTMGPAAEQLAKTASVKLSALTSLSASPLYEAFLANPNATTLGALLDGVYGTSATTLYTDFLADPNETTLRALLAVVGAPTLGAVPVYLKALSDPSALAGINGLSALPDYLGIDPPEAAPDILNVAVTKATLAQESASTSSTPTTDSNPSVVQAASAALPDQLAPAPPVEPVVEATEVAPTAADNSGADSQHVTRDSKKFTPESIGDSPLLFGSGTPGGEGMRGYGSFLKKLGISGGEESSSGTG